MVQGMRTMLVSLWKSMAGIMANVLVTLTMRATSHRSTNILYLGMMTPTTAPPAVI